MTPRLSADVRRCLVAWVRQEPETATESHCGRVKVRGRWLWWRGNPLAVLSGEGGYPARVWRAPVQAGTRRALEREVLRLLPFSQVLEA